MRCVPSLSTTSDSAPRAIPIAGATIPLPNRENSGIRYPEVLMWL